jgi:NADP-dependent 3-hydroxy acid dehydrogenase YdfG
MASLKVDEWDRMIDVDIKGVLHGIAAVLPVMNRQGNASAPAASGKVICHNDLERMLYIPL